MENEELEEDKILLFGPKSGKSLLRLYPELAQEPIFKNLPLEDLNFVWYVGNLSSPIDEDIEERTKYQMAANVCIKTSDKKRIQFSNGDISDDVKRAILKMKTYSPDARMMAKKMAQGTFYKFQELLKVDVDKDFVKKVKTGKGDDAVETEEIDWSGRKSYVDSATKIIEMLPELVKKLEEGFGITGTDKKDKKNETSAIDRFHNSKKE